MSKLPVQGDTCLNCGKTLQGPYCSACGQKALDTKHESFWKTMAHFLGDFIHFDSQIFRTALPLLFRPGYLANEYLAGRRTTYFNPIRMYVFLSFVFFFLYFTLDTGETNRLIRVDETRQADSLLREGLDTVRQSVPVKIRIDSSAQYKTLATYDSAQAALPEDKRDNWIKSSFVRKGMALQNRFEQEGQVSLANALIEHFTHNIPKLLFLLLPLLALILKLVYFRRRMYYVEHLIVTVYYYDFFYLFGSVLLLLEWIFPSWSGFFSSLQWIGPSLYFVVMLRTVYDGRWGRTLLKTFLIGITFGTLMLVAFLLNLLAAFWSL